MSINKQRWSKPKLPAVLPHTETEAPHWKGSDAFTRWVCQSEHQAKMAKLQSKGTMQSCRNAGRTCKEQRKWKCTQFRLTQVHGINQKIYAMGLGRWLNGQRYFLPSPTTWFFLSPETTWWKECLHPPTNFPLTSTQNKCKSKSFKILVHKASKWNEISVNPKTNWK